MADNGLWFVDASSTTNRGTRAHATVTTPSSYQCQKASGSAPSLVWYAFIGVKDTYAGLTNFEAGVYLDTDGKIYLFHLGAGLTGQNAGGWDTALISATALNGVPIKIEIDCKDASKLYVTATWSGGIARLTPNFKVSGYNQGVRFKKEVTLGTGFGQCLTALWSSPYTSAHRNAYITNFKMGPVTVADRDDIIIDTINGGKNCHVLLGSPCNFPGSPSVSSTAGIDTVSYDMRV